MITVHEIEAAELRAASNARPKAIAWSLGAVVAVIIIAVLLIIGHDYWFGVHSTVDPGASSGGGEGVSFFINAVLLVAGGVVSGSIVGYIAYVLFSLLSGIVALSIEIAKLLAGNVMDLVARLKQRRQH